MEVPGDQGEIMGTVEVLGVVVVPMAQGAMEEEAIIHPLILRK